LCRVVSLSALIAAVIAVVAAGVRATRDVRARLTERKRARKLAQGTTAIADREVATVEGTVCAPAAPLTAPLSGRSCVAYHAVATLYRVELGKRIPVSTIEEHRLTPFALEITRGGETVTIDGDRAELAELPRPLIPRKLDLERSFVARHSQPPALARDSGFEEVVIAVGDRIRVQGLALVEAHEAAEQLYRDGVLRVRIVAHPGHPLTIGRR
jgi:hypothetical protein